MGVRSRSIGNTRVLELSGGFFGIQGKNVERLRDAIAEAAANGNSRLVVDVSKCTSMTSDGLAVLCVAHLDYKARGGVIKVCGRLQKQLKIQATNSPMLRLFDHYPSVAEALASFSETPKAPGHRP